MLSVIIVGIALVVGYVAYYVNTVGHAPAEWHIDPLRAVARTTPNTFYVGPSAFSTQESRIPAPIYEASPEVLAEAFDVFVMGQPKVERIAGSVEQAHLSYVQRSETIGVPDVITVKFLPIEGTENSTVAIYSRSRFGYGDLGVNEARVTAWLNALSSFEP